MEGFPAFLTRKLEPLGVLGAGGMGRVFRARDRLFDREVAVKVVLAGEDPKHRARFEREAQLLAGLDHPNLARLYDYGVDPSGQAYLVTKLVPGESLARQMPYPDVVGLARQLMAALDAIHAADLVHRDLKPANVMVDDDGHATLIDFGLARGGSSVTLTRTGVMPGTMFYMPPECFRGELAAAPGDWYSMGVTLFEALEGRHPYGMVGVTEMVQGRDPDPVLFDQAGEDHPAAALIRACLAVRPQDRPASLAEGEGWLEGQGPRGGAAGAGRASRSGSEPTRVDRSKPRDLAAGEAQPSRSRKRSRSRRAARRPRGALVAFASAGLCLAAGLALWWTRAPAGSGAGPLPVEPAAAADRELEVGDAAPAAPQGPEAVGDADRDARAQVERALAEVGDAHRPFVDRILTIDATGRSGLGRADEHLAEVGWQGGPADLGPLGEYLAAIGSWARRLRAWETEAPGRAAFDDPATRERFVRLAFRPGEHLLADLYLPLSRRSSISLLDLSRVAAMKEMNRDLIADLAAWPEGETPALILALEAVLVGSRDFDDPAASPLLRRCLGALEVHRHPEDLLALTLGTGWLLGRNHSTRVVPADLRRSLLVAMLERLPAPADPPRARALARVGVEVFRAVRLAQPGFGDARALLERVLGRLETTAEGRAQLGDLRRRGEVLAQAYPPFLFPEESAATLVALLAAVEAREDSP